MQFQFDFFDYYKIEKPIRLIELFGGVGSQAMALRDIGADFEHYRLVEFDKYPVASYNAIHGTSFEPTDITKIDGSFLGITETDKYEYIMTYSFPCQDLSLAGKGRGMKKGSGTRSGLLWEVERLLTEVENLPQVLLMENVPQVIGEKNKADFEDWLQFLRSKGYSNYYKVLNAKDYGIAQNRERCFMVSILCNKHYDFPEGTKLKSVIRDYLESDVPEKFYIRSERALKLINYLQSRNELPNETTGLSLQKVGDEGFLSIHDATAKVEDCAHTITARYYKGVGGSGDNMAIEVVGQISNEGSQCGTVVSEDGIFPTLSAGTHGYANQHLLTRYRIRKLTPRECWRLMGFTDTDFDKASAVNSNTQLYKQAGNSIVKNVLMAIFDQLIDPKQKKKTVNNEEPMCINLYTDSVTPAITTSFRPSFLVYGARIIGRDPQNPKSRKHSLVTEQMIEINENPDITGTLTTVTKDNMILVRLMTKCE